MRFYTLLADEKPVGRMLLDDDGTGYAVLDCLPTPPLRVRERTFGEPWVHRRRKRHAPGEGAPPKSWGGIF